MPTGVHAAFRLALVVLWSLDTTTGNRASVPSAVVALLAAVLLTVEAVQQHNRVRQPSTPVLLFLVLSLLSDAVQSRTLWLDGPSSVAITSITSACVVIQLVVFFVESNVAWLYTAQTPDASPETASSIYSRSAFFWLVPIFRKGYQRPLELSDLWSIDPALQLACNGKALQLQWKALADKRPDGLSSQSKSEKHRLLKAILRAYVPFLLAPVPARLVITGFTYAQPFLLFHTTTYIQANNANANIGYGLIASFGIVYVGLAVSRLFLRSRGISLTCVSYSSVLGTTAIKCTAQLSSFAQVWHIQSTTSRCSCQSRRLRKPPR